MAVSGKEERDSKEGTDIGLRKDGTGGLDE